MLHRTILTALLGLSLGACNFSYSSGSRSSSNPSSHSTGKPVHHSSGKVDNRGKAMPKGGSSGSGKSMGKATSEPVDDTPPTRADNDDPPTRTPSADAPQRTKVAPKRTKVPTREPVDDDTVNAGTSQSPSASDNLRANTESDPPSGGNPSASSNLKAKTKTTPPKGGNPSASGKLVAPH
ncbi:MAG TPA: hypothetical protein VG755_21740 [Nannocystaceae bacterium]|nr:hypothetical protein [Nannocystaceae bacterium]